MSGGVCVICNYEELFLIMENSFLFAEMFNRRWVIRCLGDLYSERGAM